MNTHLDERDLALLHALQLSPRISWAEAARVLGSTASTLAGRWHRLRSEGAAWVTVHPGRSLTGVTVAFIDIDVAPTERDEVVRALCRDPRAATIEEAASGRDLLVTVFVADQDALARFALEDLASLPGVRRIDTRVATRIHWEGSQWRLDALDRNQQSRLRSARDNDSEPALPPRDYWPLVEALTRDGRCSAADLARLTGRKPATVRRQLARLIFSGLVSFRCEIAQLRSRWPVICTWFARVPQQELERTVQSLTTLPELRLCASVSGEANLMFTVWAGSPGDLLALERRMNEKLPWMTLVESVFGLRTPKRMGWILDPSGHSTGQVVVPLPAHASQRSSG
ncbi:Lrp/AsnC family transcriptional regulator [Salinifilum aidingensis]